VFGADDDQPTTEHLIRHAYAGLTPRPGGWAASPGFAPRLPTPRGPSSTPPCRR
jgi:hypothetical protein